VRSLWVGTLHHTAAVHLAMSELTGLYSVTQQHVDLGVSRVNRDSVDLQKFVDWLEVSDPFSEDDGRLRSLVSGVVVCETDRVTCDSAEGVGRAINERWNDVSFYDVCLKKSDKVVTKTVVVSFIY